MLLGLCQELRELVKDEECLSDFSDEVGNSATDITIADLQIMQNQMVKESHVESNQSSHKFSHLQNCSLT